jgi:hypothetical protein
LLLLLLGIAAAKGMAISILFPAPLLMLMLMLSPRPTCDCAPAGIFVEVKWIRSHNIRGNWRNTIARYWSVPKIKFVFVQHLKIAKLVANTLKSR